MDGLRALVDDKSCKVMCDSITDRGVAEVYVELVIVDDKELDTEGSDWEVEATKEGFVRIISSPEKIQKDVAAARKYCEWIRQTKGKKAVVVKREREPGRVAAAEELGFGSGERMTGERRESGRRHL